MVFYLIWIQISFPIRALNKTVLLWLNKYINSPILVTIVWI